MMKSYSKGIKSSLAFEILTEDEKKLYNQYCSCVNYTAGETIFKQDTPVSHINYLQKGLVKIENKSFNRKTRIVKIIKGGNFFELTSVIKGGLHQNSAISLVDSEVYFIDKSVFFKIVENNGKFAKKILELNSQYDLESFNWTISLFRKQLPGKVADLLLFFSNSIYESTDFELPLSRRELAEFIGVTKKSFIYTMGEFIHDGIIKSTKKKIEIIRMDIVEKLSQVG